MQTYPPSESREAKILRDEARVFFWTAFLMGIALLVALSALHWSIMHMLDHAMETSGPVTVVHTECPAPIPEKKKTS